MRDKKELLIETKEFVPEYGTEFSAGFDIKAYLPDGEVRIGSGERVIIPSGIKMGINPGYEVQLRSRSGLTAKHGIIIAQGTGTIDEDYTGEVGIVLRNDSNIPFYVTHGMKVCQGIYAPVTKAMITVIPKLDKVTKRGAGGYGSTGV